MYMCVCVYLFVSVYVVPSSEAYIDPASFRPTRINNMQSSLRHVDSRRLDQPGCQGASETSGIDGSHAFQLAGHLPEHACGRTKSTSCTSGDEMNDLNLERNYAPAGPGCSPPAVVCGKVRPTFVNKKSFLRESSSIKAWPDLES